MQSLPPEILALIVAEMWRSRTSLSPVSLAWPDIVPVVREQRFQHLQVSGLRRTAGLVAIIDSTPEISTVIRTIHANSTSEENMASKLGELIHLLSKIGNLERLSLHCLRYDFPDTLPAYANLTTLSLSDVRMSYLSDLLNPMHSMPHLSTLSFRRLTVSDLYRFASSALKNYPRKPISLWDGDSGGFVAPTPVQASQVRSLILSITSYADAILLDLISSTKSPFPNIEEITILCNFYKDWPHFPLLLRRYDSSLRVLSIAEDVVESDGESSLRHTY